MTTKRNACPVCLVKLTAPEHEVTEREIAGVAFTTLTCPRLPPGGWELHAAAQERKAAEERFFGRKEGRR